MKRRRGPTLTALVFISSSLALLSPEPGASGPKTHLEDFLAKKRVTIAVTDSGLGGLAILAEAAERMARAGVFEKVDFVFANALFSNEGGYNSLRTTDEKAAVFDSALRSMVRDYHPDLILIACNTLSAIYDRTTFSKEADIPVMGIIDAGVELAADALRKDPRSVVLLFGTPTTVSEGTHVRRLADLGFAADRVVALACPELETFIEKNPAGDETAMLIAAYAAEARGRMKDPAAPFAVSLNCTHYGYALKSWEAAFSELKRRPLAILNPNSSMLDFLFKKKRSGRLAKTEVGVRVVSMVKIADDRKDAIGRWLQNVSPATAAALANYELKPGLFEWKSFIRR